jgi:glycosyltransferase involved in cell wall biosynthesis
VVDDASASAAAVEEAEDRPQVRLMQSGAGPAAARNSGASAALGTYICFTDDDCEPQPDWGERITASLRKRAAAVAGLTVNGLPETASLRRRTPFTTLGSCALPANGPT